MTIHSKLVAFALMFVAALALSGESEAHKRIKGTGETLSLAKFQAKYGFSHRDMKKRFGAVGRVYCGHTTGTAFLLGRADVFVTSDHVFLSPEKQAKDRGRIDRCFLEFFYSKGRYKIKPGSLVHGLRTYKTAHRFEWFDWAVGKLHKQVPGVTPYALSEHRVPFDLDVLVVSQGINDFRPRICAGKVLTAHALAFTTTCDSGPGASGGPIVAGRPDQAVGDPWMAVGLTYGWQNLIEFAGRPRDAHLALPFDDAEFLKAVHGILGESSTTAGKDPAAWQPTLSAMTNTRQVAAKPAPSDSRSGHSTASASASEVCRQAVDTGTGQWLLAYEARDWFLEAERRKLTATDCLAMLDRPVDKATNAVVCQQALDPSQWTFDFTKDKIAWVAEARKRQLSPEDCRQMLGLTTLQPRYATDIEACERAVAKDGASWTTAASAEVWLAEVKTRRLTVERCNRLMAAVGRAPLLPQPVSEEKN
jgi:hypothetical protein